MTNLWTHVSPIVGLPPYDYSIGDLFFWVSIGFVVFGGVFLYYAIFSPDQSGSGQASDAHKASRNTGRLWVVGSILRPSCGLGVMV